MNHVFPVDIQQRIDAQLAMGSFKNHNDVLREALAALERRQSGLAQLRESVGVAETDVSAGRVGLFHRDEIKRDVRNRLAERDIHD